MAIKLTLTIAERPDGTVDVQMEGCGIGTEREAAFAKAACDGALLATQWLADKTGGDQIVNKSSIKITPVGDTGGNN